MSDDRKTMESTIAEGIQKGMTDPPPNHVINIYTDKIALILPPDWDYNLVESIMELESGWEYSISFKGAWGTQGTGREQEQFFADHYDFEKLKRIATAWDLKGHTYSILLCANPNFMDRIFYKSIYLMGEGDYSGTGPIHLTLEEKRQLADGWGISLEELIRQRASLKIVPLDTPACAITRWQEWSLEVDISVPPVPAEERIAKIGDIIAFHAKEVQRLREAYFKTLHTAEERQYYRDVWGFDPAKDRIYQWEGKYDVEGEEGLYQYEAWYPLLNDPALQAIGVEIGARVRAIREKSTSKIRSQNQIVFRRAEKESAVECIHVVLINGLEEANPIEKNLKAYATGLERLELVSLTIPEHFVALNSFIASIVELGIIRLLWEALTARNYDIERLEFGFNPEMQMQVLGALNNIAPSALTTIKRDWFMQLVDSIPSEWFYSHLNLLVERGLLRFEIEEIQNIFPSDWLKENRSKVDFLINALIELNPLDENIFRQI